MTEPARAFLDQMLVENGYRYLKAAMDRHPRKLKNEESLYAWLTIIQGFVRLVPEDQRTFVLLDFLSRSMNARRAPLSHADALNALNGHRPVQIDAEKEPSVREREKASGVQAIVLSGLWPSLPAMARQRVASTYFGSFDPTALSESDFHEVCKFFKLGRDSLGGVEAARIQQLLTAYAKNRAFSPRTFLAALELILEQDRKSVV